MRRRNRTVDVALGLAMGALLGIVCLWHAPLRAGGAGLPELTLDEAVVTPGSTVTVEGAHWPKSRALQAAVCGDGPFSVSSDCDLMHAISFGPADDGVVHSSLIVTIPPVPCPCVVMVTQPYPSEVERLPITILGSTSAPVERPSVVQPILRVSHVRVVSTSSWTSWFGAAASRQLIVNVHNGGSTPVRPLLVAQWIQGTDRFVITSPQARVLGAGRSAQIAAPFDLSTFSDGTFPVVGKVSGDGFKVPLVSSTSASPWALYVLGVLAAVAVLLALAVVIGGLWRDQHDEDDVEVANREVDDATPELTQLGASQ